MKQKLYALGKKMFLRPAKSLLPTLACALLLIGNRANAQCSTTTDFSSSIATSSTQTTGGWYPDRYAPAGFTAPANGPNSSTGRLKQSINSADGGTSRPSNFQARFTTRKVVSWMWLPEQILFKSIFTLTHLGLQQAEGWRLSGAQL